MTLVDELEQRIADLEKEARTCMVTDSIDPEMYLAQARGIRESVYLLKAHMEEHMFYNTEFHHDDIDVTTIIGES